MQNGNWTPISKSAVSLLPKNRAYTELEALYCLQVDYNNRIFVTVNGYARLWGWSYRQVVNLFDTLNLCLEYPEDTHKKQNQSGVLIEKKTEKISEKITERSVKDNRKIKFIFTNDLQVETERYRKDRRKITERSVLNDYKTLKTEDLKDLKKEPKDVKKKIEIYLPEDFGISDSVKAWAEKEGYGNLDRHLAYFRDAALAKGYKYIDWNAAFRNAIKSNWAKINKEDSGNADNNNRYSGSSNSSSRAGQISSAGGIIGPPGKYAHIGRCPDPDTGGAIGTCEPEDRSASAILEPRITDG